MEDTAVHAPQLLTPRQEAEDGPLVGGLVAPGPLQVEEVLPVLSLDLLAHGAALEPGAVVGLAVVVPVLPLLPPLF